MDSNDPAKETEPAQDPDASIDALETPEPAGEAAKTPDKEPEKKKSGGLKQTLRKFNIYLILFIFLLLIAAIIISIAYFQSKKASTSTIKQQSLSNSTLQQLANSDANVGGPQEVLNVESNAVFAGKVLIRDTLELAGGLQVTGTTSLSNLGVTGNANLQSADIAQDLTVGGTLAVQGSATFNQGIQVNGTGTFSGAISTPELTTPSFQLNGDLTLTHHVNIGGSTPSSSSGTALGSGGTASLSGSDTAGSVNINTGGGPGSGCFITVTFSTAFKQTPYVNVTPIDEAAGGLAYYVTRTDTDFKICDASSPPANANFAFDYFIVD
jgi:cytoskeletal protein CcmA (bactofilin family)